ncbi:hypothetical protein BDV96DRAFT_648815 [Lophiotrema nucula]|uniref:Uncharacterized protein n=1 Tax=Lophiotrema nucula TaxID=690887 RepID=A0A6A5Z2D4_9PLEO|nr:hypothetical protein BDV96DRAFT_648815 [Lophiotrema nucula]
MDSDQAQGKCENQNGQGSDNLREGGGVQESSAPERSTLGPDLEIDSENEEVFARITGTGVHVDIWRRFRNRRGDVVRELLFAPQIPIEFGLAHDNTEPRESPSQDADLEFDPENEDVVARITEDGAHVDIWRRFRSSRGDVLHEQLSWANAPIENPDSLSTSLILATSRRARRAATSGYTIRDLVLPTPTPTTTTTHPDPPRADPGPQPEFWAHPFIHTHFFDPDDLPLTAPPPDARPLSHTSSTSRGSTSSSSGPGSSNS